MKKNKGLQIVAEALRMEDYPIDKSGINYSVGDLEVEDSKGRHIAVRDIVDQLKDEEFRSPEEVMRAIYDAITQRQDEVA